MIWVGEAVRYGLIWIAIVLFGITSCESSRPATAPEVEPSQPSSGKALPFRSMVYSTQFAGRFDLPQIGVSKLPEDVHAVVLRVSHDARLGTVCALDIYLNDDFAFAYPHGTEGSFADLRRGTNGALGFFVAAIADDTKLTPLERRFREPRALFRPAGSDGSRQDGQFHALPVESFYRGLAPELNVVSFEPICSVLHNDAGVEVWLLRNGHSPEALSPASSLSTVALSVEIPGRLLRHARRAIEEANRRQGEAPIRQAHDRSDPPFTLPPAR